jgi:hypothetical protein
LGEANWSRLPTKYPDGVKTFGKAYTVLRYLDTNFSAVSILDGSDTGTGSVVYYSFSIFCLPKDYRTMLVRNSVKWFNRFGVSVVTSKIIHSPPNSAHFVYSNNGEGDESRFDTMTGGMLYALCENEQIQEFADATDVSNPNRNLVALFGNPFHNEAVGYYNSLAELPVTLHQDFDSFVFKNSLGTTIYDFETSNLGNSSAFLVQVFTKNNTVFLVIYGLDWRGTWAAATYFSRVICQNLSNYSEPYYIFEWVDKNTDAIPQLEEISSVSLARTR